MTESIYNNAGVPSEQGAAPEIPEDLRKDHAQILRMRAKGVTLPWFGNDKQIELIERIAALTLERDTLKAENAEGNKIYEAVFAKFDGCPHAQQVNGICGCSFDDKDDVCALHAPQLKKALEEVAALKATVERLSAPVSDEEPDTCEGCDKPLRDDEGHETDDMVMLCDECWQGCADDPDCHSEECPCEACAAKIGTMKHPINDDEQRRKDAAWNDRAKARCICGEMIAWYSGEWLHVAGRSKSCADGRLASPAHFLVGMPPA